jgi:acetyltransferase-like isoleucine patch superfamily enzyme
MLKHFQSGGFLYGLYYSLWRGYLAFGGMLSTLIHRRCIDSCGKLTTFGRNVYIGFPKKVRIGDHCFIGEDVKFYSELPSGKLTIHNDVQISSGASIDYTGEVIIGSRALISPGVEILIHDHGYDPHSLPVPYNLVIEEDAWIGMNAIIMPHVGRIGKGAIIGIGSIVTKTVPDMAIMAGNPARIIKYREDYKVNNR